MSVLALGALYLVAGAGAAVVHVALSPGRGAARALDAAMLLLCWPLYGPFLLALRAPGAPGAPAGPPRPEPVEALRRRLAHDEARLREIDAILARPGFSEADAVARVDALRAAGASDTAISSAILRLSDVRRLAAHRARLRAGLDEAHELLKQLPVHAEVPRLLDDSEASTEALVRELLARAEAQARLDAEMPP
jgi:hypothetical protein